jgi:valyl-tRNA synthetase
MTAPYPQADPTLIDSNAEADLEWVKGVIDGIRNIRGEMNIPPSKALDVLCKNGGNKDRQRLEENRTFLKKLAKLASIDWLDTTEEAPLSATQLVGEMEVLVPMAGLIDKDAELARLNREIEKLAKEITRTEGKLGNSKFVDNAPADVVEKERDRLKGFQSASQKLAEQLQKIKAL